MYYVLYSYNKAQENVKIIYIEKKSAYNCTHTVQTYVVQGSAVIFPKASKPLCESLNY